MEFAGLLDVRGPLEKRFLVIPESVFLFFPLLIPDSFFSRVSFFLPPPPSPAFEGEVQDEESGLLRLVLHRLLDSKRHSWFRRNVQPAAPTPPQYALEAILGVSASSSPDVDLHLLTKNDVL